MGRLDAAMAEALLNYFRTMDHQQRQIVLALARRIANGESAAPKEHDANRLSLSHH